MMEKLLAFLRKLGMISQNTVYYIGGTDVLPPPLKGQEENEALISLEQGSVDAKQKLIEHKIPAFLVCGDVDKVVPYPENGVHLAKAYRKSDVAFEEILKSGCDHHPHGLEDLTPLVAFAEKYC